MNDYWIIYDLETGDELFRGYGQQGAAVNQTPPEGAGLIVVPLPVVRTPTADLAALREYLAIGIDNMAERVRSQFVTALPAQVGTYLLKEAAARAWLADDTASTVMLQPEATARGMTVAELANEVVANASAWALLSGQIEGLRFAAKERVAAAATIGAMAKAAEVDWSVIGHG